MSASRLRSLLFEPVRFFVAEQFVLDQLLTYPTLRLSFALLSYLGRTFDRRHESIFDIE
jgi:hypothetical protein